MVKKHQSLGLVFVFVLLIIVLLFIGIYDLVDFVDTGSKDSLVDCVASLVLTIIYFVWFVTNRYKKRKRLDFSKEDEEK